MVKNENDHAMYLLANLSWIENTQVTKIVFMIKDSCIVKIRGKQNKIEESS
jgi:hypothetical protein